MLTQVEEGLLAVHNIGKDGRVGSWKISYSCDSSTVVKDLFDEPGTDHLVTMTMDHDSVTLYICDEDAEWREKYRMRSNWTDAANKERIIAITGEKCQ
jgi:hypothetical protein